MKLILVCFGMILSFTVYAEDKSSGCGMGWKVAPKNTLISSFTRSYTNLTFSNTLGMTSGTSGCAKHNIAKKEHLDIFYAESNFNELMVEMAQGEGQYLEAFAVALGCSSHSHKALFGLLQTNYTKIYSSESITPIEMLRNTKAEIRSNKAIVNSCFQNII